MQEVPCRVHEAIFIIGSISALAGKRAKGRGGRARPPVPLVCLVLPLSDLSYPLATDRTSCGMGAVITPQWLDGSPGVIAYPSKSCNEAERNYSSYEGEMLAAV